MRFEGETNATGSCFKLGPDEEASGSGWEGETKTKFFLLKWKSFWAAFPSDLTGELEENKVKKAT